MSDQVEVTTASDPRLYSRGFSCAHSSDDGGQPDVGLSVGLGGGWMLYAGERPGAPGWCLCLYHDGGEPTIKLASALEDIAAQDVVETVAYAISKEQS